MNPNDPIPDFASQEKRFGALLEKPPLFHDPVFPKENYLEPFAKLMYAKVLMDFQQPERARVIETNKVERHKVTLLAGNIIFFAFDFEEKSERGATGREIFLDRVKGQIYRLPVPPQVPAYAHQIVAKGVFNIQTATGESLPGVCEVCKLKTIGWVRREFGSPENVRLKLAFPRPFQSPIGVTDNSTPFQRCELIPKTHPTLSPAGRRAQVSISAF